MVTGAALVMSWFAAAFTVAEGPGAAIALGNGAVLFVTPTVPSRNLPHAPYDQAMSSIPQIYPESRLIAHKRVAELTARRDMLYSLVSYKKTARHHEVAIVGVVTGAGRAWHFHTTVAEEDYADTLPLVLDAIRSLPWNKGG